MNRRAADVRRASPARWPVGKAACQGTGRKGEGRLYVGGGCSPDDRRMAGDGHRSVPLAALRRAIPVHAPVRFILGRLAEVCSDRMTECRFFYLQRYIVSVLLTLSLPPLPYFLPFLFLSSLFSFFLFFLVLFFFFVLSLFF